MRKQLGRFHHIDADHSIARDDATKTLLCTFVGDHIVGERENGNLCIYAIGDSGMPGASVVLGNTGDRKSMSIADLNKLNAARRGEKAA